MEKSRVIGSAFRVGGFTSLSRLLGLVRDILMAKYFGDSAAMSDYVTAFRIPNLFRALFGEGALSSAFVPVFLETRRTSGESAAWQLAGRVISVMAVFLCVLVAVGIVGATILQHLDPSWIQHAERMLPLLRIMLPYTLFICLAALSQAILNSYHRFSIPALTPSLLNLTVILFILFVCPLFGAEPDTQIAGVAWGIFAAGIVQLGAQVPLMLKLGYRPGFHWTPRDPQVRRVFALMGPTTLGQSVNQVNVMVNGFLARWAAPWAPSSLFFAERLIYLPQGLLATALGSVLLPVLSDQAARQDRRAMQDTLSHGLRTLLFVMTPAAIGLCVLSEPIVRLVYSRGLFGEDAVWRTTLAVRIYAPGLMLFCLAKVFVPGFYALKNTRTPYRISLVAVGLNASLCWYLVLTLPEDIRHAGLALATVLSETFNGLTLGYYLHRVLGPLAWSSVRRTLVRALALSLFASISAWWIQHGLQSMGIGYTWPTRIVQGGSTLVAIGAAIGLYFLGAALIRAPELGFVRDALTRKRSTPARTS